MTETIRCGRVGNENKTIGPLLASSFSCLPILTELVTRGLATTNIPNRMRKIEKFGGCYNYKGNMIVQL